MKTLKAVINESLKANWTGFIQELKKNKWACGCVISYWVDEVLHADPFMYEDPTDGRLCEVDSIGYIIGESRYIKMTCVGKDKYGYRCMPTFEINEKTLLDILSRKYGNQKKDKTTGEEYFDKLVYYLKTYNGD